MSAKIYGQSFAAAHSPVLKSQRVCLADDDPTFVHLAKGALASIRARLDTVIDGSEALGLLLEREYDTAILRLSMPLTNGFRLLAFIRNTRHLRNYR